MLRMHMHHRTNSMQTTMWKKVTVLLEDPVPLTRSPFFKGFKSLDPCARIRVCETSR